MNRRLNQQFVKRALNTLYETLHGPVKLVYGQSRNVHTFVFMFVSMCNDNEEQYQLLNLIPRSAERPCRMCNVPRSEVNMRPVGLWDVTRNGSYLHNLGYASEDVYLKSLTSPLFARQYLTETEKQLLDECRLNGMYPGRNPVLDLFEFQMFVKIGDPFCVSIFDTLHTLYTGPVEQCIRYAVTCIYLLRGKVTLPLYTLKYTYMPLYTQNSNITIKLYVLHTLYTVIYSYIPL
jgi:hypothetical protein